MKILQFKKYFAHKIQLEREVVYYVKAGFRTSELSRNYLQNIITTHFSIFRIPNVFLSANLTWSQVKNLSSGHARAHKRLCFLLQKNSLGSKRSQAEAGLNILKVKFGEVSQSRYTGSVGGAQRDSYEKH